MRWIAVGIVLAALAVFVPQLMLVFLLGNEIAIPARAELAIGASTGIGSGLVLTVSNAMLSHVLATHARARGTLWWLMALVWGLLLVGGIVLIAPVLVFGARQSALAEVLTTPTSRWLWAICAVALMEMLVAAAVAANALRERDASLAEYSGLSRGSERWGILLDAVTHRIARSIDPVYRAGFVLDETRDLFPEETLHWVAANALGAAPAPVSARPAPSFESGNGWVDRAEAHVSRSGHGDFALAESLLTEAYVAAPVVIETAQDVQALRSVGESAAPAAPTAAEPSPEAETEQPRRARTKAEALERTVELFRRNPHASVTEVAQRIGRSESTVRGYLTELEAANRIVRDGAGVHVPAA